MLEHLLQLLRSEEMPERWKAVERLRTLSAPGKLERIAGVARHLGASGLGRRDAIALIAGADDPEAGALLLALAVESGAPADARGRAVTALAARDPAALAQAAGAILRDPDPAVRAALVADAGRLPRECAETIVRAALDDPATAVRSAAWLPIAEADLRGFAGPVTAAFAKIEERIRREKGSAGTWDVAWEEEALLRALAKRACDPEMRQAVTPITGRPIELAADSSSTTHGRACSPGATPPRSSRAPASRTSTGMRSPGSSATTWLTCACRRAYARRSIGRVRGDGGPHPERAKRYRRISVCSS